MQNAVVVRFMDGSMVKGTTSDFHPTKDTFHVVDNETREAKEVGLTAVKAIFFVKTFEGDKNRQGCHSTERRGLGKKIMVNFKDGEILLGYATSYSNAAVGFFVFPADPDDNNDRVFVVNAATNEVRFLVST